MLVVCGREGCRREFKANPDDPSWRCPGCGHVIENRYYPFLDARIMEALRNKAHDAEQFDVVEAGYRSTAPETDWRAMFDYLFERAREMIAARDAKIAALEARIREMEGVAPDGRPGTGA